LLQSVSCKKLVQRRRCGAVQQFLQFFSAHGADGIAPGFSQIFGIGSKILLHLQKVRVRQFLQCETLFEPQKSGFIHRIQVFGELQHPGRIRHGQGSRLQYRGHRFGVPEVQRRQCFRVQVETLQIRRVQPDQIAEAEILFQLGLQTVKNLVKPYRILSPEFRTDRRIGPGDEIGGIGAEILQLFHSDSPGRAAGNGNPAAIGEHRIEQGLRSFGCSGFSGQNSVSPEGTCCNFCKLAGRQIRLQTSVGSQ